jgi:hypothetical protein
MKHMATNTFSLQDLIVKPTMQLLFKRTNVAFKLRTQLFLSHIGLVLLAALTALVGVMCIELFVNGVATLNLKWLENLNLSDRASEYAGLLTAILGLAGRLYLSKHPT